MYGIPRFALSSIRGRDTICILGTIHQHGGFAMTTIEAMKIYYSTGKYVVHIPACRGEELFLYLANHGIESRVSRVTNAPFDRLEVEEDVNVDALRAVVDQWVAKA